jgi:hypothetical protein
MGQPTFDQYQSTESHSDTWTRAGWVTGSGPVMTNFFLYVDWSQKFELLV